MGFRQEVGCKKWYSDSSTTVLLLSCFLVSILSVNIHSIHVGVVDFGVMMVFSMAFLRKEKRIDFLFIFPILFLVSMGWSVIYNVFFEKDASTSSLISYIRLVLIFSTMGAAAWAASQGTEKNNKFITSLFFGLLVTSILGIVLYAFNIKVSPDQQRVWFEGISGRLRAGGVVGNTGAFGHQVFLLFSMSLFLALKGENGYLKYLLLTIALSLSFFNIITSSSRGALLGVISFLVIYFIIGYNKRMILCLVAASAFITFVCANLFLDEKLLEFSARRIGLSYLSPTVQVNTFTKSEDLSVTTKDLAIPASDKPSIPASDKPSIPASDKPSIPASDKPSIPVSDKPSIPASDKPSIPASDKPSIPASDKPSIPASDKIKVEERTSENLFLNLNNMSSGRFSAWEHYATNVYEHLFWGVGYKNSYKYYGSFVDNSFMSVLIEGGIISLILFTGSWVVMIYKSMTFYRLYDKKRGAFLVAFACANLFQSFFLDIYSQWISFPVFIFVIYSLLYEKDVFFARLPNKGISYH